MKRTSSLVAVLDEARWRPFTTKGDFARNHADVIAMAASDGLLTTRIATGLYGRKWSVTAAGLRRLETLKGMHQ